MHVQVVTCTVQFILSFSNISPSYELVHVGYLYDCWLASAMCPPATAGAAGWLPGIRNMIRIGLIPFCQINQPPQSPLGWLIIRRLNRQPRPGCAHCRRCPLLLTLCGAKSSDLVAVVPGTGGPMVGGPPASGRRGARLWAPPGSPYCTIDS